jgi:tetratricopeptide (TPR) repeat protein
MLTESSRRLLQGNEPLLAARLLNDQAAIYVRLGDPARATHFLAQSRELFAATLRQHPDDRVALEELAATDHLLARLPLHLPRRPGRENEAAAAALEHARAAERTYHQLGQHHDLARVWETIGRLALQNGQLPEAKERLSAAHALQRQLGDVTGLARSTAALADLCAQASQWEDALALLADSIQLNITKGSPIGLAFNRRALALLSQAMTQQATTHDPRLHTAVTELSNRLTQAEAMFGQMGLPDAAA